MLFTPRPKGLGKDNFLKLNDQEEVTGVFKGEIYQFRRHWINATSSSLECTGDTCPVCTKDPEAYPSFRARINFVTSKDGKWIPKIFEMGGELYDTLVGLDKKFGLAKTIVDIQRLGTKQNTRYQVLPRVDIPLTKEVVEAIDRVALLPLSTQEPVEADVPF